MTSVVAFDVNETLLDLSVLDASFEEVLGSASLRSAWFAQMLQLSFIGGLTGEYVDFTTAQRAAFAMVATRAGRTVTEQDAIDMVDRMSTLPPHPEVADALAQLRTSPLHIVALVNSVEDVAEAQLTHAGIHHLFDGIVSADSVKALKPARAPYQAVADRFNVDISEVRLVAAHSWDISGALVAGCKAAFVRRPGMVLSPIGAQPDIDEKDISAVVEQILLTDLR